MKGVIDVWTGYQLISHVIRPQPLSVHIFHKIKREMGNLKNKKNPRRHSRGHVLQMTSKGTDSKILELHSDWLKSFFVHFR